MSQRQDQLHELLPRALELVAGWGEPGPGPAHPALEPDRARFDAAWGEFAERMGGNYPFHHPRYAGQMLKPPHPVAIAALHGGDARQPEQPRARRRAGDERDGGRGRARPGRDVRAARRRARPPDLVAARSPTSRRCGWRASCTPARRSCYGANAHYTHARMCAVLGIEAFAAPSDAEGRIDLDVVECAVPHRATSARVVRDGRARPAPGTVDHVDEALALRERYGVRVHVDAAYGGFFTLLARGPEPLVPRRRSSRSPSATASSSTRTSTGCSRTAAARSCSATRRSAGSTSTTRRTPTSRRATCTWARSASSARAPAPRPPRCG